MKNRLLKLVICPECGGDLSAVSYDSVALLPPANCASASTEIMEGLLTCHKCRRAYPIIGGVPRLLPDDLRPTLWKYRSQFFQSHPDAKAAVFGEHEPDRDKFTKQKQETFSSFSFQRVELTTPDLRFSKDWLALFAKRLKPHEPEYVSGKLGLDAGCGFGQHLYCAGSYGAEMVGLDVSEGVQRAFETTRNNPRIHVVQGDIYRMPFRTGEFDFAMSFGVLHHLPDPRSGFLSLSRAVRPGGDMLIWVYGYKGMRWTYRRSHFRTIRWFTRKLPHSIQYGICAAIALILEVVLWWPSRILGRFKWARAMVDRLPAQNNSRQPFAMKVTAVFDRLATPITHFHDREELMSWFGEAGFGDFNVFSEDRRGWQGVGKKMPQ